MFCVYRRSYLLCDCVWVPEMSVTPFWIPPGQGQVLTVERTHTHSSDRTNAFAPISRVHGMDNGGPIGARSLGAKNSETARCIGMVSRSSYRRGVTLHLLLLRRNLASTAVSRQQSGQFTSRVGSKLTGRAWSGRFGWGRIGSPSPTPTRSA